MPLKPAAPSSSFGGKKGVTNTNKKGGKPAPPVNKPTVSSAAIADIFGALGSRRPRDEVPSPSPSSVRPATMPSGVSAATGKLTTSSMKGKAPHEKMPSRIEQHDDDEDEEEEGEEEEEDEEEELTAEQEVAAFKRKIEHGHDGDGLYRPTSDEIADNQGLFRDLGDDVFFSKRSAATATVKHLEDGTRVVTEDTFKKVLLKQTSTGKKAVPGTTPHCPFDCDCCF